MNVVYLSAFIFRTPIISAAINGYDGVVLRLAAIGANLYYNDTAGKNVLQYARGSLLPGLKVRIDTCMDGSIDICNHRRLHLNTAVDVV